jgi:rod shape-determining protein MreD
VAIRVALFAGLILTSILMKTIVLPAFAIGTFRPDVLVLVVVAVALVEGPDTGIRLGFAAGLVQDLVSGGGALVGVGALVMMGVGYAAGSSRPYLVAAQRTGAIALCGAMAAAATLASGVLGRMFGVIHPSFGRILLAAVVVGLYSALISPLVLGPIQRMIKQFPPASMAG